MKPARLILIGPPAAGKTTLGRRWAHQAKLPFWDTDEEIVCRTGRSIEEWFQAGETCFRQVEWDTIVQLLEREERGVIAVGGGFPAQPGAMSLLLKAGYVLWIDPPIEWLVSRWRQVSIERPPLHHRSEAERIALMTHRRSFYREADLHWPIDIIPENLVWKWAERRLRA
ncbi:MAG: shikimate kinase [Bacteroidia bacterium]|nr:shikimate kinase [Bacteroidia bacterium]